ncbi:MAG: transglutaminase domain-containing protein [Clostridia bacterium]|nr:transglutaminase domain-containing protein [Clostridia bacterium]
MQKKLRGAAAHGLTAYLLSLGMALTVLGATGLLHLGWTAALTLLAVTGVLCAASLKRPVAVAAGALALFAGGVWLLIGGGKLLLELLQALALHTTGLTAALPIMGEEFCTVVCVLCALAGWFVTQRSAGAYSALMLLMLMAVLLWLSNMGDVLICLLPAVLSCVILLLRAGNEQTGTLHVLPLAAVVTAIAFAGVAAGGVTSQPMKELADSIRQRIYDVFFFTQPRDAFKLAIEGYYPQGEGQLGGPATPREEPVMEVRTPRKAYLRGVARNHYDGRAWTDKLGARRYLWTAPRFDELRTTTFDLDRPYLGASSDTALLVPRKIQVRMLRDSKSTLFVPQRIRALDAGEALIPYFNGSSEIFATANLEAGDFWTVEAPLFVAGDRGLEELVNNAAGAEDANWKLVCENYLQLHDQIDHRVYDMAAQMTARAATPYARAMALQQYLSSNFVYTLDAPLQPENQDFVSTFLVETKEGYCTHFATAMTVMCRMAGLPARYVEGYVAYPDVNGYAVVTGMEGHAWTEVYFRGFGWVTFDATPVSADYTELPPEQPDADAPEDPEQSPEPTEQPTSTPLPTEQPEEQPTPTPAPQPSQPSPQPSEQPENGLQDAPADDPDFPWGMLLLLLLAALAAARIILTQPDLQAKRCNTEFRRWLTYTQAAHDALRRQGLVRGRAETPSAFLRRAAQKGFDLTGLAAAENLMFYGHAAPYPEETQQARSDYRRLYSALKPWQKLAFHLQRALRLRRFDLTDR